MDARDNGEKFLGILGIEDFNFNRHEIYKENETFEFGTGRSVMKINFPPTQS